MNIIEIERLVKEDEINELNNINNINSKLNKLEKDSVYRKNYFDADLSKYNAEELKRLKREYYKELSRIDRLELINRILNNINIKLDNLENTIDNCEISAKLKKERLQKFKQDISYLIYLGEISTTEAITRGFSIKEINRMRRKCLREKEQTYESYLNTSELERNNVKTKRYN